VAAIGLAALVVDRVARASQGDSGCRLVRVAVSKKGIVTTVLSGRQSHALTSHSSSLFARVWPQALGDGRFYVLARLVPGATLAQANRELARLLAADSGVDHPEVAWFVEPFD